jgi:hypothetical protein
MKSNEKAFDAVHLMREIRDKLSQQITHMSFEEQKRYMKERLATVKVNPTQPSKSDTQAA